MDFLLKSKIIIVVLFVLLKMLASFPVQLNGLEAKEGDTGEKIYVSNIEELRTHVNESIPAALLSDVSPPEYFKQHRQNLSSEFDLLTHLLSSSPLSSSSSSSSSSSKHRSRRSTPTSCPVTWAINFEADRVPVRLQKAVCNTPGTTCLSSDGIPSCEEISLVKRVYKFHGWTPDYKQQIWQIKYVNIPIACSCTAA